MPKFAIWRELDPSLDQTEREELTVQLLIAASFFPSVRWSRSYVIDEPGRLQSLCVYEAPVKRMVSNFSLCFAVPYSEIREVKETLPDAYIPAELNRVPEGARLYMIDRQFPDATNDEDVLAIGMRAAFCCSVMPEIAWVRSYWDADRKTGRCIYWATDPVHLQVHAERTIMLPCDLIEEVFEEVPANWVEMYDGLGLDRHWEPAPVG